MVKKNINICLVTTTYSFLLYLLLNEYNEDDIFIFGPYFPREISKNIKHHTYPDIVFRYGIKMAKLNSIHGIYENIRGYILYFYTYIKLRIIIFIRTFNKNVKVYGHAQTVFSFMFFENENSNIIEDGVENYVVDICETHKINKILDTLLHICGIYYLKMCETYGSHKNIKNIYLTSEHNHPLIKDKVRVIDFKHLWKTLAPKRKEEIFEIFNVPQNIDFESETALILTQPLFEAGLTTFEEEINMYKEMIHKFKNYQIIIKPHPHDKKDYNKLLPNTEIIESYFPIELLTLIGINPTVVCSIASAAACHFENSAIYLYQNELKNTRLINARKEILKNIKEKNLDLISE